MSEEEKRIVREMHCERLMSPTDIAKAVGRGLSSICRLLAQKKPPNPSGGRAALSKEQVDRAVKILDGMIDKADGCEEITLGMLKKRCKLKC
jgi:transposase